MMAESPDYSSDGHEKQSQIGKEKEPVGEASSSANLNLETNSVTLSIEQLRDLIGAKEAAKSSTSIPVGTKDQQENVDLDLNVDYIDNEDPLSSDDDTDVLAAPIDPKLAAYIDSRLTEEQSSEKLKSKFEKASRPANVNFAKEIKIDRALYNSLSIMAKRRDNTLKKIQLMSVKAINNVAKVADILMKRGKGDITLTEAECKELHSYAVNGLGLMCQTSQRINTRRVSCKFKNLLTHWSIQSIHFGNLLCHL